MRVRHYSGEIRSGALEGKFECWEDSAGRYRIDVDAGAVRISNRVDGENGFSLTPGGQVETLSAQDCERRLLSMLVTYAGVLKGDHGAKISDLPGKHKTATDECGFRVSFPNGDEYDFYLRPDGELRRVEERVEGRASSTTTFSDWRMVNGVRLPYATETVNISDGQSTTLRVTEDRVNPELDVAVFAKPEVKSRLAFSEGAHDSGVVPFELFSGDRLFFSGAVGGKDLAVLLDSGAEVTVIDAGFARAVGLRPSGRVNVRGTGGSTDTEVSSDVAITVGTMTLRTGTVLLMDLQEIGKMMDHPVQVILGKEVLNQTVTDIDFDKRTIRFVAPERFAPAEGMTRVPLAVAGGTRAVQIRVEDHEPVYAELDLGNGGALMLYPESIAKWGMLRDRPVGHGLGGGVGGLHPENIFTVKSLEIGGYTLRDIPTGGPESADGLAFLATATVRGNVGLPVWSRFHLVLDFGRNQLFLSATPESLAAPFQKNRSGLTAVREGDALKVLFVDPSYPKPVCEAGAEIVAVDGVPLREIRLATAWTEKPAGTVVKLTFRDGRQAELTLRDQY